ncbi:MAG: hypothetical protein M9931_08125 [Chitinophagales bacterium]|nr:hypothetical protein [Chitinophagales bacterium]
MRRDGNRTNKLFAISVPSGNFGNITAGIIAQKMGLPISKFIAATNANNIVPQYLLNGNYEPKASVQTISNAMDVGNPSNFARMKVLFENSWEQMKASINGFYFSDKETKAAIRNLYTRFNYTADPHGAVGYLALAAYLKEEKNTTGIFLETAHPAKFIDVVEEALSEKIEIPQALSALASKQKVAGKIDADYEQLKAILLA